MRIDWPVAERCIPCLLVPSIEAVNLFVLKEKLSAKTAVAENGQKRWWKAKYETEDAWVAGGQFKPGQGFGLASGLGRNQS
ncbi:hypothetical protein [Oligoflexus tunisiensis]|uniref:hypothetical protein n=1 Tax=Oligoflexus tunisiensis TaxID=708132 RepID=UPI00114CFFEC|nr:hypothetical protein [Oligoflexus tunisiensis]